MDETRLCMIPNIKEESIGISSKIKINGKKEVINIETKK